MEKVRIMSTINRDGSKTEHLVNSIAQSEALKTKIDQGRIEFNKSMNKEIRNTLISIAIALAALTFMYWLAYGL